MLREMGNYELKDRGLMGINPENHDIIYRYTAISIEVQYFIFKTKRFTENMVQSFLFLSSMYCTTYFVAIYTAHTQQSIVLR